MNKESNHRKATFKAVHNGVLNRFAKITSRTEENSNIQVNKLYIAHTSALNKACINLNNTPLWDNCGKIQTISRKTNNRRKVRERRKYFLHWILTGVAVENP